MSRASEEAWLEMTTTRVFDFPREAVFEAFTNPTQLARWWGPKGFTNTIQTFDFRPGGAWHLMMHGPDGKNYPNESKFVEIVKPEKIVYHHLKPEYQMTMIYSDRSGKTELTWHMRFNSSPENLKLKQFLKEATEENFDRLEAVLNSK